MEEIDQEELSQGEEEHVESELKNKIKILKKAFVKEREEHLKLQKKHQDLEQIKQKLEMLVMEKESACTDLIKQSQSLQELILHEQMKNEELTNIKSNQGKKSLFGKKDNKQSAEVIQLQAENSTLKRQNQMLEEKIQNIQNELELLKKETKTNTQSKAQIREQYDKDIEEKEKTIKSLNRDLKNALKSNANLLDQKSQQEEQISQLNKKVKNLQQQCDQLSQQQIEKQELILSLNSQIYKQTDETAVLANKLMSLKNQLAQAQSNLQIFSVLKQGTLMNSSAQLRLIKENEQFILEICNLGKVKSYQAQDINSIQLLPEENDLFILQLSSEKETFTFESKDASNIVKKFREFMSEALDESRLGGSPLIGKQKQVLQNLSQFL